MQDGFRYQKDCAVVMTDKGPVRGYRDGGLTIFKGVPYARARRFRAPEETERWTESLDATSFGYVCPLMRLPKPALELMVPHRYWPMDEDCLNLNLWTPACDGGRRPVLVWLHGGGFTDGSAIEQVAYEGENLSRLGDAVVVTVNHRLNILGYLDLSAFGDAYANSANAGTEDIVAALRWVRRNIAAFGGDPECVTVFGQSGGGGKVTALLQTPAADGLYHRGVNMSGVLGRLTDAPADGEELARAMMRELGVTRAAALETVPYPALAAAWQKVSPALRAAGKYTGRAPMRNAFYAGDPLVTGFRRETAHVPLMVGSVFAEFTAFAPLPYDRKTLGAEETRAVLRGLFGEEAEPLTALFREAYPSHPAVDLAQLDCLFREPEMRYIRSRAALSGRTYSYLVDLEFPLDGGRLAWHCSDIPLFFRNADLLPLYRGSAALRKAEEQLSGALLAFARTGDPNHAALPAWHPCAADAERTMLVSEDAHEAAGHDARLIPALARAAAARMAREAAGNADRIAH